MKDRTSEDILNEIEYLQLIQKTHKHTDPAWQTASELLQPLFNEMHERTKK